MKVVQGSDVWKDKRTEKDNRQDVQSGEGKRTDAAVPKLKKYTINTNIITKQQ